MYWIRVDVALPTHRKTLELAEALSEPLAIAYMVRLWCWARFSAPDGRITGRNPGRIIEAAIGWAGAPGAFVTAAVSAGFLRKAGDALAIHDWHEHNGKALQKAQEGAERTRRWRERKEAERIQKHEAKLAAQDGAATPLAATNPAQGVEQPRTEPVANVERNETSRDATGRDAT